MQQPVFKSVLPNYNNIFFDLFNQAADNATTMAKLLNEAITTTDDKKPQYNSINRLRAKSQELTHQVYTESGKAFISPFERTDMFALVKAIDGVAGYINISSRRINLYQLTSITAPIIELSELIVKCCQELQKCIETMYNIRNVELITDFVNNIKSLEHYADKVYNKAVAALLVDEHNAIELIKYNEILYALESATDKCEHVTNVIESIVIKNS